MTDDLVKRLRSEFETLADLIEAARQAADRIEELESWKAAALRARQTGEG